MAESSLRRLLRRAEMRVEEYLKRYGGELPSTRIVFDPELYEETLATHRYPDTVLVRKAWVPEAVIAHELVHIAQGTLEQFRGFNLLYSLLAEGLAEWVTKELYPEHEVKYEAGYRLVKLLVETDERVIGDLLRLNEMLLVPGDLEAILSSPHLAAYTRDLLSPMAERIRENIRAGQEAGITDPTFVTLGKELRAWKFLLDERFNGVRGEVDRVVGEWFGLEEG
jgi:hypothetical protein